MDIYTQLLYGNTLLLAVLLLIKTIHFFVRSDFDRITDWLYFDRYSIYTTRGLKNIKAKRLQNTLSFIILIFIILDLIFLLMTQIA